jgi:hypothetical protein
MGIRLRLSKPGLLGNRSCLERRGCPARQLDVDLVDAEVPHAIHADQARMELDLYLNVWKKLRGASLCEMEARSSQGCS